MVDFHIQKWTGTKEHRNVSQKGTYGDVPPKTVTRITLRELAGINRFNKELCVTSHT